MISEPQQHLEIILELFERNDAIVKVAPCDDLYADIENGHHHVNDEIFYQVGGETRFTFPRQTMSLKQGELLIMPKGVPHAEEVVHPLTFNTLVFCDVSTHFTLVEAKALLETGFPIAAKIWGRQELTHDGTVYRLLEECRRLATDSSTETFLVPLIKVVMKMFYHSVVEKPLIENPHYPSELVNAAVHMIQNHAGLPHFNVQYLAKRIQCSPNYLSALFSKEVGQTISQYLLQTRLGMAKQLFNSSEKSVAQIAQTCGFSSTSYFIAQFKRMEGCTPKAYRVSQYSSM